MAIRIGLATATRGEEEPVELADLSEPVMAQFDRLPLPMQMRVAARVLQAVNSRDQGSHNGVWWPTELLRHADKFEHEDYEASLAKDKER